MARATGHIGTVLPMLHELSKEEHSLPTSAKGEVTLIIAGLEEIQSILRRLWSEKPQGKLDELAVLWDNQAADLAGDIIGVIEKFRGMSISAARQSRQRVHSPGDFIAKINSKQKASKARRTFVGDIRNASRLVKEFAGRHGRYRIDSTLLPLMHLADHPHAEESPDGVALDLELPKSEDLRKLRLPRLVQANIAILKAELEFVKVVRRMLAGFPTDKLDKGTNAWAEDLREVASDIELAVDRFNSATTFHGRRQFAAEIGELKYCLLEAAERRQRYDLSNLLGGVHKRSSDDDGDAVLSGSVGARLDPVSLVAIDKHRDFLVKLLTDEASTSDQHLRIASIVGPAGVGKTTLAKEVHRIMELEPQFDCTAWVSVPSLPDPGMKPILHDLLQQINKQLRSKEAPKPVDLNVMDGQHEVHGATPRPPQEILAIEEEAEEKEEEEEKTQPPLTSYFGSATMDDTGLIDKIRHTLRGKRYFVIVEDIWDSTLWDTLKHALIENGKGSAVLTTSRKVDIAEYVLTTSHKADTAKYICRLEPLSGPDSRKLFHKTFLFHSKGSCPRELAEKSERLIDKCGGIPLVVIATAGLLANKPWTLKDSVDCELLLDQMRGNIPYHLRPFLFYFSMFRKSCVISSEHLVWGWIAEGFIPEIQGQTVHEVGETYLNELIKRNFIEAVEVDAAGKVLFCRVADLVHEWIILLATEDNFATIIDGKEPKFSDKVHRLSIQGNSSEQPLPQKHLSHIRSLIVSGDVLMPSLSDFKELRALDLGGCDCLQDDHLRGIENSFLLKYLVIGGNSITGIPKEIVNLSLLQTLDLRASGLNELPECVFILTQLERLYVSSHMKIPDGLGKMAALQELSDINVSKAGLLDELCRLAKLRIVRLAIWSWDESLKSYDESLLKYLHSLVQRKQNIQCLSILTCSSLEFMDQLGDNWAPSLQMLEIRYSAFDKLTTWIGSLDKLSSLSIEVYNLSQDIIDMLGKMPGLCSLSLTSKCPPEGQFGDGFGKLTGLHFASNAMGTIFAPKAKSVQVLKRLKLSFHVSRTKDVNQEFKFGLENLSSLEHVHIEIICFNACRQVVKKSEDSIEEAISRGHSRRPKLDIRRVQEENMLPDVVLSNGKQEQQKEITINKKKYHIC